MAAAERQLKKRPRAPQLRWSRFAELDLELEHARLDRLDPAAARRWAQAVLDALDRLLKHPSLGTVARDLKPTGRYRHLIVGHHRLIYRVQEHVILILRVWDARQDPGRLRAE